MRIAVISDIHANLEALTAVFEDMDPWAPAYVVSLGDNVGYGADPEAVLAFLREQGVKSVMGNHEYGLTVPGGMDWFNPTARLAVARTRELLCPESLAFIAALPKYLVRDGLRFVHGMPPDKTHNYFFKYNGKALESVFTDMTERVAFIGHTHMLEYAVFDGKEAVRGELEKGSMALDPGKKYILNIGSVGQPRDGNRKAKYALYDPEASRLEIRFVAYDRELAAKKIRGIGMPVQYADKLL